MKRASLSTCVLAAALGTVGIALSSNVSAQTADPPRGGTAIFALSANPAHFNSAISTEVEILRAAMPILEGLTFVAADMQPKPELAQSWTISDDGKSYTFNLRKGVRWHDGKPFTSADVKYTIENILALKSTGKALSTRIASVDTPDDTTVVVKLKEPFPAILVVLSDDSLPILPAHLYQGTRPSENAYNLRPVGTGPFKFVSFTPGSRVEMERNDSYWGGRPNLDRLVWTIVPDANSRLSTFKAGGIDYIFGSFVDLSMVKQFRQVPGAVVGPARNLPANMVLVFNNKRPPFDNPAVRRALVRGIDRDLIITAAFDDQAQVSASAIPRTLSPYYSPDVDYSKLYPYDPKAAKEALASAGVRNLTIRLPFRPDLASAPQIADILKSNWENMGISVKIEPQASAVWSDIVFAKRDFDATLVSYGTFGDPVLGIQRTYICENDPKATFTNPSGYCKAEVDDLFSAAATARQPKDRAVPYAKVQKIIAEDLPSIALADNAKIDVGNGDRLGGLDKFTQSWDFSVLYLKR